MHRCEWFYYVFLFIQLIPNTYVYDEKYSLALVQKIMDESSGSFASYLFITHHSSEGLLVVSIILCQKSLFCAK